jgi:hypothetical protein
MCHMENGMEYRSHDFYLSACLLASGLRLKNVEASAKNYSVFVFDDPQNIAEKIISEHWNRNNSIPTRNLIEAINELKTRLYSGL